MSGNIKRLAIKINMPRNEFIAAMRKCGCSEPTAEKIWEGKFEDFDGFKVMMSILVIYAKQPLY